MVTITVTYWNGTTERFTGTEAKIEKLADMLSRMRTVTNIVMEG